MNGRIRTYAVIAIMVALLYVLWSGRGDHIKVEEAKKATPTPEEKGDPVDVVYRGSAYPRISEEEKEKIVKSGGDPLYGELTMAACERLFERARMGSSTVFYDLGCGAGKGVLKAHTWGVKKAVGVELSVTRFALAQRALEALKRTAHYDAQREVRFENTDMFTFDISDANVVFLNMYNAQIVQKVADRIRAVCKPGTIFATMHHLVDTAGWNQEARLHIRMSWSTSEEGTPVSLYKLLPPQP